MTTAPTSHPDARRGQAACGSAHHDGGMPVRPAPGQRICAGCRGRVEERLVELPALFELCADMLASRPQWIRERPGGQARRGIVLRDAVVSVRTEITGVLRSWCELVAAERAVPGPPEVTVRGLVRYLAVHLHWLCGHPAAPRLVDELSRLTEAVDEALRPDTGFRVPVGRCPHPGCTECVYAQAHRADAEPYEVSCAAGHVWAPRRWLLLRGRDAVTGRDPSAGGGP